MNKEDKYAYSLTALQAAKKQLDPAKRIIKQDELDTESTDDEADGN